ncbi:hypothetical protein FOIG_16860 [Fusarium odoratissimum NRRL 54006]|uniref:Uncharacterized protein n=1 Tax=Fusarium odoratissimum (strain NRRL 54006) TaxID=1089451 RepID=X0ILZ6_FUSO5|nr:uncharacterized protein FOIG_16860 [Fusarium odoratissimum NRRL 54006]EXL89857.1 hypothetical protein FOIG_16860 [Fusarium odoratissimum NRRL 54006]
MAEIPPKILIVTPLTFFPLETPLDLRKLSSKKPRKRDFQL